jgi:hypothetical protein
MFNLKNVLLVLGSLAPLFMGILLEPFRGICLFGQWHNRDYFEVPGLVMTNIAMV